MRLTRRRRPGRPEYRIKLGQYGYYDIHQKYTFVSQEEATILSDGDIRRHLDYARTAGYNQAQAERVRDEEDGSQEEKIRGKSEITVQTDDA